MAQENTPYKLIDGLSNQSVALQSWVESIQPGTILVLGEEHGQKLISEQHMLILNALRNQGLTISVGMEFFNYTDQSLISQWRAGSLTDENFKIAIGWSGYDFSLYANQLAFPLASEGATGIGINLPRAITSTIAKTGFTSLTPEQRALIPADFTLGRDSYRERFYDLMGGGHVPADKLENYFTAQSTWDEVMAYQSLEYMKNHVNQVFVIVVGEFHVQYGGGLPDRLKQRIAQMGLGSALQVKTVSQVTTQDMTEEEIQSAIAPSEKYGPRADYIMLDK